MTTAEERAAAREYLAHDHAAVHLAGRAGEEAHRHAEEIDDRHPRARDIALTGTARELGQLPPHLARHQREARKLAGLTPEDTVRIRNAYRAPERESAPPPSGPIRARRGGGGGSSYATGLIGAAGSSSWGETLTQIFAWGMGLSIGYLLLTRVAAVGQLTQGAANLTRVVVSSTIDPLNPGGVHPRPVPAHR